MHPSTDLSPQPLFGGRSTTGIVRIGDTVRRPLTSRSPFVHALLLHLEAVGFDGAPRFRGIDEEGREVLTYLAGEVPHTLPPGGRTDAQLLQVARLLRAFHDATAGSALAGDEEVVCHNDFAPWNTVFVAGLPVAVIDFDNAHPGSRLRDLSYFLWCWLGIHAPTSAIAEQARRLTLICDSYGLLDCRPLATEIAQRQHEIHAQHMRNGWTEQAQNVAVEMAWFEANRIALLGE